MVNQKIPLDFDVYFCIPIIALINSGAPDLI